MRRRRLCGGALWGRYQKSWVSSHARMLGLVRVHRKNLISESPPSGSRFVSPLAEHITSPHCLHTRGRGCIKPRQQHRARSIGLREHAVAPIPSVTVARTLLVAQQRMIRETRSLGNSLIFVHLPRPGHRLVRMSDRELSYAHDDFGKAHCELSGSPCESAPAIPKSIVSLRDTAQHETNGEPGARIDIGTEHGLALRPRARFLALFSRSLVKCEAIPTSLARAKSRCLCISERPALAGKRASWLSNLP